MNNLIMEYFIVEGYRDAAEQFSKEASIGIDNDLDSIQERMNIRKYIQEGEIDKAILKVNDINPEILDLNPRLYFHLQLQKLIEFIRNDQIDEGLEFAQSELALRGEEHRELLEELEQIIILLVMDKSKLDEYLGLADLFHFSKRQKTASELNSAILLSQARQIIPRLPSLLKLLIWAQKALKSEINFPIIDNLLTCQLEE